MASTTTTTTSTSTTATETVAIHTFPETGRGLQAQLDIKEDAIILSAKWEAVWSVEAALNEPVLGDILKQNKLSVDDTLALFLLFVKLSPKCSRDQHDQRRVHVKSGIPESYTASCFFTDEDLEIAQGSSLYNLTIHSQSQSKTTSEFTLDEYKWALFTVWSRAMDFNVSAETSLRGVVPFLDMVNHSFDVKQCHAYDPTEKAVKILAGKSYKKGDEVFINYGPVSNTKLLRLYGFVVPGNPYNAFELV
ncbi:SET domain-containing protein [Rhizoclosmatium globosum]|uniref:SET domain-containing protein n=1 Tax=Rhizoclosmatium globosum TaxID=329046 RepID=A0A1Y2CSP8_9FUNG|nr:SET domain-containing protein [Rhizoclosmatium globosum]|eukprot:ORY50059.1 SET domain-containing protein [Rhizoclosmatium globosum]